MEFSHPKPRRESEPALPMINVVFLLLIFFLMSAQIVTPPPFEVTPPASAGDDPIPSELRLHISADAKLAIGDQQGDAVWAVLATIETPAYMALFIRADAALPAHDLAKVLQRVSGLGFRQVQLATVAR